MTGAGDVAADLAFELATPARIVFGAGSARQVGEIAASYGRRALVVTGTRGERARGVFEALTAAGVAATGFAVTGEPTIDSARAGVTAGRAGHL